MIDTGLRSRTVQGLGHVGHMNARSGLRPIFTGDAGAEIIAGDALLLEIGDFVLLESGTTDKLLLEPTS